MNPPPLGKPQKTAPDSERVSPFLIKAMICVLYLILLDLGLFLHNLVVTDGSWDWGWTIGFAALFYFIISWRTVGETELGATFFGGRPVQEHDPGFVFVPPGILRLRKDSREIIEIEIPGEPEEVQKYDEDNIRPGMKAPIRINNASPETAIYYNKDGKNPRPWRKLTKDEQKDVKADPLSRRLTTEVSGIVRFRIRPHQYIQFLQMTGDVDKAKRSIEDMWVSTVQTRFGTLTPSHAISRKNIFDKEIFHNIKVLVGEEPNDDGDMCQSWGIDVQTAQVKLVDTGKTVNQAIANAAAADFEQEGIIAIAEGKKKERELQGDGERHFLEQKAFGEAALIQKTYAAKAEGLEKIAKIARTIGGARALQAETVQEGLKGSQYTVIGDDFLGAAAGFKEVFTQAGLKSKK